MLSEVRAVPGFCVSTVNVSHTHHVDNVLQSTMMWLFVTIAYITCISEKSDASPEVSMDVVSPDFSPFFSCLGTQATYAAIVWAGAMVSVCVSSPGFCTKVLLELLSPCAYLHGDLWQTFMGEFGPSQQVWSTQLSQAWSFTVIAALLFTNIDCNMKNDNGSFFTRPAQGVRKTHTCQKF